MPKSELEIAVTVPVFEFEPYVKKAAVLISEEVEIEGFRKGKAPYEVIKNKLGEQTIYERAAELAIRKTYPELIAQLSASSNQLSTKMIPIGNPEVAITKLAPGNELQYKVKLAILPEVKLPDYKKIAKEVGRSRKEPEITDEETTQAVDWIRESRVTLVTVDRPAQKGDRVEIDFELRHDAVKPHTISGAKEDTGETQRQIDAGVKIAGGNSKNHPLILGKGNFMPGFEEALKGMRRGEEKNFIIEVPEEWHEKSLAGKTLNVKASMKLVQDRQIPELNDEFAKRLGNFPSAEALKTSVQKGLLQEKQEKEKQRIRTEIIEKIARGSGVEIPEVLIEREIDKIRSDTKVSIEQMGMKWENYLLHINPAESQTSEESAVPPVAEQTSNRIKKSEEELRENWRSHAEIRVKQALCLHEIAKIEKIEPSAEEIATRANEILRQYRNSAKVEKTIDDEELKEYAGSIVKNEKVFELLENNH